MIFRFPTFTRAIRVGIAIMSLACAAAATALLIRSHLASDQIDFTSPNRESFVSTTRGGLLIVNQPHRYRLEWQLISTKFGDPPSPYAFEVPGETTWFDIRVDELFSSNADPASLLLLPIWLFVVASAAPFVLVVFTSIVSRRRRRRRSRGFDVEPVVPTPV